MPNFLDNTIAFIQKNALWIIIGLIIIFVLYLILSRGRKKELKPISRAEVERKMFIERNKLNNTGYKWLYRGKELLGKIQKLRYSDIDLDKKIPVVEMVIKPVFLNLGFYKMCLGKENCISVRVQDIRIDKAINEIEIDEKITFDKIFGIYYDRGFEKEMVEHIKTNSLFRTDWDSMASVYYVKSQEQATFNPPDANAVQMKQLDLEIEKQKRAKLVS